MEKAVHVRLHGKCWEVTQDGCGGVLSRYANRRDALREAVGKAHMEHMELVLHAEDGSVAERLPHGVATAAVNA
jgi:Uncharacterized protein conserved in bacteria (DUF2188)